METFPFMKYILVYSSNWFLQYRYSSSPRARIWKNPQTLYRAKRGKFSDEFLQTLWEMMETDQDLNCFGFSYFLNHFTNYTTGIYLIVWGEIRFIFLRTYNFNNPESANKKYWREMSQWLGVECGYVLLLQTVIIRDLVYGMTCKVCSTFPFFLRVCSIFSNTDIL